MNKQTNQKQSNNFISQFTWWKLDAVQLEKQVSEYTSLRIYKSYRGIAVLLITGWVFLTKLFSIIQWIPKNKFIISLFIYKDIGVFGLLFYLFLIVLIYKGKRWAIMIMMFNLTINSGYALLNSITSGSIDAIFWLMILFWWALFMRFFYAALKVEQLRNNVRKSRIKPLLILKENKKKVLLISLGLLLLTCWFYWFQYRPAKIRSYCHNRTIEKIKNVTSKYYKPIYDACLNEKGVK